MLRIVISQEGQAVRLIISTASVHIAHPALKISILRLPFIEEPLWVRSCVHPLLPAERTLRRTWSTALGDDTVRSYHNYSSALRDPRMGQSAACPCPAHAATSLVSAICMACSVRTLRSIS